MKGLFIPEITAEMFRNGCLESIETLIAEGEIYDIDYQQPCEGAVSRQAVIDTLTKTSGIRGDALKALYDLPSVTPQPKTVLYSGDGYADGYMVYDMAECPNCGYEYEEGDKDWGLHFCPNCGQSLNWESEG